MSPTRNSNVVTFLDLEPALLDHLDSFPVGDDVVLAEELECPLGECHHLSLLEEEAMACAPRIHFDEEPAPAGTADGTGGEPLRRAKLEPAHGRLSSVFTARTKGMPPLANSSTVTDDGATAIRWKRSSGWPR